MQLDIHPQALSQYTTLQLGGLAQHFVQVHNLEELKEAVAHAKSENLPYFILGGGSNLLVNDEGFDGLVIHMQMKDLQFLENYQIQADAGVIWDEMVLGTCERNWGGIEAMSGIPGTCGGGVVQNIGAYGQEISESIQYIDVLDPSDLSTKRLGPSDMEFRYRHSRLKGIAQGPIIYRIALKLAQYDAELATKRCQDHGFRTLVMQNLRTATQLRLQVLETRKSKGMVYNPDDYNTHSVGSFFTNPIIPEVDASRLNAQHIWKKHVSAIAKPSSSSSQSIPMFPVDGGVKLSAAWLIEQCGFERGYSLGNAALSEKHCLAIVNRSAARCTEVLTLASNIARKVRDKFRVTLNPEALYLGLHGLETMPLDLDSFRETTGDDNIGKKI